MAHSSRGFSPLVCCFEPEPAQCIMAGSTWQRRGVHFKVAEREKEKIYILSGVKSVPTECGIKQQTSRKALFVQGTEYERQRIKYCVIGEQSINTTLWGSLLWLLGNTRSLHFCEITRSFSASACKMVPLPWLVFSHMYAENMQV